MANVISYIIVLLAGLFIFLQIIFAIQIKAELFKLRQKGKIMEEDAIDFLQKLKYILWIPYSGKYFNRMREIYGYFYQSPLVRFETKLKLHKSLSFRLVQEITAPKKYDSTV
ncbi:MAG: hypothetical protein Q8934_15895 [Bacillota bacterium]|nr:hypothetical protein [Bacillota bacterium]